MIKIPEKAVQCAYFGNKEQFIDQNMTDYFHSFLAWHRSIGER